MVDVYKKNIINYKGFPLNLDVIADEMTTGCLKELKEIFFLEGHYSPIVRWCATLQNEWPNSHRALFSAWRNGVFNNTALDVVLKHDSINSLRDSIVTAEHSALHSDFSFKHVGSHVKAHIPAFRPNESLLRVAEHDGNASTLFVATCYMATIIREQPLLAMYQHKQAKNIVLQSMLIVPVYCESSKTVGVLANLTSAG